MQANIRRSLCGLAAGVVLSFVVVAPPAAAAPSQPVGGCAPNFELFTVDKVVRMARPEFEADIRKADRNADNYLCVKTDETGGTYTDNNRPL